MADAVHVALRLRRGRSKVDDVRDAGDVDLAQRCRSSPARARGRCETGPAPSAAPAGSCCRAGRSPNAAALERVCDTIGGTLGTGEDDDPRQCRDRLQLIQQGPLSGRCHEVHGCCSIGRSTGELATGPPPPPPPPQGLGEVDLRRHWSRRTATIAVPHTRQGAMIPVHVPNEAAGRGWLLSQHKSWVTSFSFINRRGHQVQTIPGVPTTMSAPARIRVPARSGSCYCRGYDCASVSDGAGARRLRICNASSRVGANMHSGAWRKP